MHGIYTYKASKVVDHYHNSISIKGVGEQEGEAVGQGDTCPQCKELQGESEDIEHRVLITYTNIVYIQPGL